MEERWVSGKQKETEKITGTVHKAFYSFQFVYWKK